MKNKEKPTSFFLSKWRSVPAKLMLEKQLSPNAKWLMTCYCASTEKISGVDIADLRTYSGLGALEYNAALAELEQRDWLAVLTYGVVVETSAFATWAIE